MNRHTSASPAQRSPAPDRAILRTRLEETQLSFHALIAKLTDEEWDSKRTSTHWTVRELLSHIVDGLAHTPEAIEHVRRGKPFLTLPPVLNWLTELGNQDSSSFSDSFVPTERNQHVHLTNRAPSPQLRCLEEGI